MGNVILDKSVDFAVRCVKFYNYLRDEKREYVMSKQLLSIIKSVKVTSK